MDYASAMPLLPEVLSLMENSLKKEFYNPSSIHKEGVSASGVLERGREKISKIIGALPSQIIFTSGATESNNMAIIGSARQFSKRGDSFRELHFIASEIEHSSVMNSMKFLEENGAEVDYVKVDRHGVLDLKDLKNKIKKNTILISIMFANNEIGTIQPLGDVVKIVRRFKKENKIVTTYPLVHSDIGQASLYEDIKVSKLGVDLISVDGGKIYGPKGIGLLYLKNQKLIKPILFGGEQERGLRPGTENIPAIVGLTLAMEIAEKKRSKEVKRLSSLQDYFFNKLEKEITGVVINGAKTRRMPNNVNIFIPGIESEFLIIKLDHYGVSASSQSACLLKGSEGSYVINAIRGDSEITGSSVRFSLGIKSKKSEIDEVIYILKKIIKEVAI